MCWRCRGQNRVSLLPIPCDEVMQESSSTWLVYRPHNVTWQLKPKEQGSDNEKAVKTCHAFQKILSKGNERCFGSVIKKNPRNTKAEKVEHHHILLSPWILNCLDIIHLLGDVTARKGIVCIQWTLSLLEITTRGADFIRDTYWQPRAACDSLGNSSPEKTHNRRTSRESSTYLRRTQGFTGLLLHDGCKYPNCMMMFSVFLPLLCFKSFCFVCLKSRCQKMKRRGMQQPCKLLVKWF